MCYLNYKSEYLQIILVFLFLSTQTCRFFFEQRWKLVCCSNKHRHFENTKLLARNDHVLISSLVKIWKLSYCVYLVSYCLLYTTNTVLTANIHSQKCCRLVAQASCQIYQFVSTCQQVETSLSISSSCNKSVKIRLVATCHLQTCYNLLKKVATRLLNKLQQVCWQLATSPLTTCKRLVVNKLSIAMQTHPDISLLNKLSQDVNRLVTTYTFLAA